MVSHSTSSSSADNSSLTSRASLLPQDNHTHHHHRPTVVVTVDDLEFDVIEEEEGDCEEDQNTDNDDDEGEAEESNEYDDDDDGDNDNDDDDDRVVVSTATATATKATRSLNFQWEDAKTIAKMGKTIDLEGTFVLPKGITKSDIMVMVDIDDEIRWNQNTITDITWTTNVGNTTTTVNKEQQEQHPKIEYFANKNMKSSRQQVKSTAEAATTIASSSSSSSSAAAAAALTMMVGSTNTTNTNTLQSHCTFEETIRKCILDDLQSIYTAPLTTAKVVLCIVICSLSDGTINHSIRSNRCGGGGGSHWMGEKIMMEEEQEDSYHNAVGVIDIALNWRLFDADNLKVYEGGLIVQRSDYGSGPFELTDSECRDILLTKLAPRAANVIMRKIGSVSEDLLVEV
jgi:hypothetical protein